MATVGHKEEWTQYAERLEHFFAANGITNNDKKHSMFLTVIDAKATKPYCSSEGDEEPLHTSSVRDCTAISF